jgi:hypothetical protein
MASVAVLGTPVWNTTAGNKTVTVAPAVGDLIVIVAPCTLAGGTTAVSDNNPGGAGTYTQVDTDRTGFSTAGVLTVWVRTALITNAGSTVFTATQAASTGGGLAVFAVKGMNLLGASAVRSAGGQSTVVSGTPAPVLSQLPNPRNPIITAVCSGTNGGGTTVRTGYTDVSIAGYNTPATGFDLCFRDSGESTDTITWGGAAPSQFASMAIELNTQDRPYPGVDFGGVGLMMKAADWVKERGIWLPNLRPDAYHALP